MNIISAAGFIIFMLIFLIMFWRICEGLKKFLSENIEEALIVSGDYIGEKIQNLDTLISNKMNEIQNENQILKKEILQKLENITLIISNSNDNANNGIQSVLKELNNIIPVLRDEFSNMAKFLSENSMKNFEITLKNFEEEVKNFTKMIKQSSDQLNKAADYQTNSLANMAGTIQGVLTQGTNDIKSSFNKTDKALQTIINNAMQQINNDYQGHMQKVFQAMADNLKSITEQLRKSDKK